MDINILIGCDCDPDRIRFNPKAKDEQRFYWEGFLTLAENFNRIREEVRLATNLTPALTWNLRADYQTEQYEGKIDYCFNQYFNTIIHTNKYAAIDEIAWHHHHFKLVNSKWLSVFDDGTWMKEHIFYTYANINKYDIHTVHTGELIMNTDSMNAYNDAGIKVDYSSVPGLANFTGVYNRIDYSKIETNKPYIPSRSDYQKPGMKEENTIIEFPTNTVKDSLLEFVSTANYCLRARTFDLSGISHKKVFIPINAHPYLFKRFFKKLISLNEIGTTFISYFHADELLPDSYKSHEARMLFKNEYFTKNIITIIKELRSKGMNPVFTNFKTVANTAT